MASCSFRVAEVAEVVTVHLQAGKEWRRQPGERRRLVGFRVPAGTAPAVTSVEVEGALREPVLVVFWAALVEFLAMAETRAAGVRQGAEGKIKEAAAKLIPREWGATRV